MRERDDISKYVHPQRRPSFWRSIYRSLQFKTALLVILLMLIVVSCGIALSMHATANVIYASERQWANEWAKSLASTAAPAIAANNRQALLNTIETLIQTQSVAYVAFADPTGRFIAYAESQPGLLKMTYPSGADYLHVNMLETPRVVRNEEYALTCIDVTAPIYDLPDTQANHEPKAIIGYIRIAVDVSQAIAKLTHVGNYLLRLAIGLLLLVIPCTLLMTRRIVSPLNELAATARALANGAMEARVSIEADSELGDVARSFNVMANRVTQSQMELIQLASELEERVEQRTRELEELASKDSLTGLHNRRHFSEVMQREFAAAGRYNSDLTCLMFDVDLFKQINDRYGHGTGDEVLIILGRSIMSQLRSSDVAARFGGDEFILLLPQTSAEDAIPLANRIVEQFKAQMKDRFTDVQTTVSVGVASIKDTRVHSAEALINQADLALYEAKASGRNCTKQAGEVITTTDAITASHI